MIEILKKVKEKSKKDSKVIAALIFGSYPKKGYRDIDICLILDKKLSNIELSKKKLSYQKISSKLDIQIMQQLPLYIKKEILNNNKPLLIKNNEKTFNKARDIIKEFDLYEKHYNEYLEQIKNGTRKKAVI
jgi:predicted nucleotidyltransferase